MAKKHYNHLSEEEYGALKKVIDTGAIKLARLSKATGRAYQTLVFVRDSKDFEDYHRLSVEHVAKYSHKEIVRETTSVVPPTAPVEPEVEELELLRKIEKHLADLKELYVVIAKQVGLRISFTDK